MKKKNFITLMMSAVGGIIFALGMCMALLPEWGAMRQGIVIGHDSHSPQDGRQTGDCL